MTIEIKLTLTETQWSELANALNSKIILIERGDYGEGESDGDNERWVAVLQRVLDHAVTKIKEKGIAW